MHPDKPGPEVFQALMDWYFATTPDEEDWVDVELREAESGR